MDLATLHTILGDGLAGTLLAIMVLTALVDFLTASVARLRDGTFTLALLGHWASEKGIAVVSVILLYALARAAEETPVPGAGVLFGVTATAMGVTFAVTQAYSSLRNLRPAGPMDATVVDEATGA